ncbi:MAG: helix-turn-helix transcriptional regulator [Bdellovibrionota bacterium]|nr:hypothetical protein [Pseudobdellovibrionaceae bacterium]|tara:strand:- start:32887 stop:33183 length:297 start_codon:yes stop_codon:yes gene_type:complete
MGWSSERIRQLRLKLGWSRAEFGRRLGLNLDGVYKLEDGALLLSAAILDELDKLQESVESYSRGIKYKASAASKFQNKSMTQATSRDLEEIALETETK